MLFWFYLHTVIVKQIHENVIFFGNHYGRFLSNLDDFRINECFCYVKLQ